MTSWKMSKQKLEKVEKHNSPIKYFGGKGTMFNKIFEYFPEEYSTYVEPFAGSFSLGLKQSCPIEVYNDLEQNVYTLYKVISDPILFEKFKFLADLYPYSQDFRQEFKDKLKKNVDLSEIDRAFYFFYVNRTSHNGVGGFSVNNVIRRNMSKSSSDYLSAVDRLLDLHHRLSKVIVLNKDGIEIIKKYNSSNTLIYCDPPYHHTTRTSTRYKQDMDNNTQLVFLETVNKSNSKILISGYKNEVYDEYLKDWEEINFEVKTISGKFEKKTKIETLWRNY